MQLQRYYLNAHIHVMCRACTRLTTQDGSDRFVAW